MKPYWSNSPSGSLKIRRRSSTVKAAEGVDVKAAEGGDVKAAGGDCGVEDAISFFGRHELYDCLFRLFKIRPTRFFFIRTQDLELSLGVLKF